LSLSATEQSVPEPLRQLLSHRERLERLLETSRELSKIQPRESLLAKIAEACGHLLDSDSVGIRVREEDDLVLAGAYGDARAAMPTPRLKIGESLSGTVAATGEPLIVSDAARDPRMTPAHREAYRRGGYKAFLGVPLILGPQVLGVLSIRTRRAQGFSSEDLAVATAFAAQAAIALENAHLYRQAEERADKLRALSTLTRVMTQAENSPQVFEAVARAAATLLGAALARVWVADPEARVLRDQGTVAVGPQLARLVTESPVIRYGEGLVGPIVDSGIAEYIPDISNDPRLLNRRLLTDAGLTGFAGLPLISGDTVVGVLALFFRRLWHATAEDRELMGLLVDQAAISVHNAGLLRALKSRQGQLETLLDVSCQLSKIQSLDGVLEHIAEACGRVLKSNSVGFRLVEGDDLVVGAEWGDSAEVMSRRPLKVGESLLGLVAQSGEP